VASQRGANREPCRIAKDSRFERLKCTHKGTYADDCLVQRVEQHKCYIVATCDRDLKRRIRKIPGVPIMYITQHQYAVERMPDALAGGMSGPLLRHRFLPFNVALFILAGPRNK